MPFSRIGDGARAATCLLLAAVSAACAGHDDRRRALLASDPVQRFAGRWTIALVADSSSGAVRMHSAPGTATGTLVFVTDRSGPASTPALDDVTHEGAYDLDVTPLGFSTHASGASSVVVARVVPGSSPQAGGAPGDSVQIVLNPESDRYPLRLQGVIAGDSVAGTWSAYSFSAGGGTGRFVMRRSSTPSSVSR